jgi:two-component system OmpR family response regulator
MAARRDGRSGGSAAILPAGHVRPSRDGDAREGRILLIDDEPRMLSLLMRVMRAHGFQVRCASDATHGWDMLGSDCSLVLLDLLMPEIDGFDLLRRIRDRRPNVPVIVLSAVSDVEAKVCCFDLGAADYVTKPFSMAELLARIRRVRAPASNEDSRWIAHGRLRLDLHRHEVTAGDRVIALSTRECALLEHLMRHEGNVCTREELLAQVWGYEFDPGTNVVDVYVRRLRTKLGTHAIETVRSAGYAYAGS